MRLLGSAKRAVRKQYDGSLSCEDSVDALLPIVDAEGRQGSMVLQTSSMRFWRTRCLVEGLHAFSCGGGYGRVTMPMRRVTVKRHFATIWPCWWHWKHQPPPTTLMRVCPKNAASTICKCPRCSTVLCFGSSFLLTRLNIATPILQLLVLPDEFCPPLVQPLSFSPCQLFFLRYEFLLRPRTLRIETATKVAASLVFSVLDVVLPSLRTASISARQRPGVRRVKSFSVSKSM